MDSAFFGILHRFYIKATWHLHLPDMMSEHEASCREKAKASLYRFYIAWNLRCKMKQNRV